MATQLLLARKPLSSVAVAVRPVTVVMSFPGTDMLCIEMRGQIIARRERPPAIVPVADVYVGFR